MLFAGFGARQESEHSRVESAIILLIAGFYMATSYYLMTRLVPRNPRDLRKRVSFISGSGFSGLAPELRGVLVPAIHSVISTPTVGSVVVTHWFTAEGAGVLNPSR